MKRAINLKVIIESERRNNNRDVLELVHTKKDSEGGWRSLVTKRERYSSGPEGALLGHLVEASLLGTYVSDCELDAPPLVRKLAWRVIRLFFYATEPEEVAKFMGLRPLLVCKHGKDFVVALSQTDYVDNMVETFEADRGRKVRECLTVGQAGACPDRETMERKPGGVRAKGPLGRSMYVSRGTRPDTSFGVSRLGRFTDCWCDWSERELTHLMGYFKATREYALHLINKGDFWEDLVCATYADSNHDVPRSVAGQMVQLEGALGSCLPWEWQARCQSVASTSSGESESVGWGTAAKAAIRCAAVMECVRKRPVEVVGRCDSEAMRMAVRRGSSTNKLSTVVRQRHRVESRTRERKPSGYLYEGSELCASTLPCTEMVQFGCG